MKVTKHNVFAIARFTIAEQSHEANTAGLPKEKEHVTYRTGRKTFRYNTEVISLGLVPRRGLSFQLPTRDMEKAFALSRWDFAAALRAFILCKLCNEVEAYTYHFITVAVVLRLQHCGLFQSRFRNGRVLPKLIASEAKFCF